MAIGWYVSGMKRALAVIAVGLMVGIALFVRSRGQETRQAARDEKEKATLYCVQELAKVCEVLSKSERNLTVITEEAGRTLATLSSADFNRDTTVIDGWLAPQPYVDLANENRSRSGLEPLLATPSRVLARSPVVMVGSAERMKALSAECGGQVSWRCLGDNAGRGWDELGGQETWGDLRPVIADPNRSATGLLSLGEATTSYFGNSSVATNDFGDPGFRDWLSRLARTSTGVDLSGQTPLDRLLSTGPASLDVAGALEAQAGPGVTSSRDKDRLTIIYPSPLATADIVLAPISGSDPGGRLKNVLESEDAARALAEKGWRVNGQPLASGLASTATLPESAGLPRPGALQALATAWQGASR